MSTTDQNSYEARPSGPEMVHRHVVYHELRDVFAGQAMAALISTYEPKSLSNPNGIVRDAYRIADAMLAERVKAAQPKETGRDQET